MTAASEAKRCDPSANVTVITEDEHIAYSPCVIPWAIEGKAKWDDIVMHDPAFYQKERGIQVLTKTKVVSVSDADSGGHKLEDFLEGHGEELVHGVAAVEELLLPPCLNRGRLLS